MNYYDRLVHLRTEVKEAVIAFLKKQKDQTFLLFNIEEDWRDNGTLFDEFFELPQEYVFGKYNYAIPYFIHKLYLEDDKLFFEGYDDEEGGDYTFEYHDIFADTLCDIADRILN